MRKEYTEQELEMIDELYDEQMSLAGIAESVNDIFHNGDKVRTTKSIEYAIDLIYSKNL